jgi:DNA-binding NarL/FixJ family response regulator
MDKKRKEPKIRVLLACCELLYKIGLYEQLQRGDDIEVIKTVVEINDLLKLTKSEKPDIIMICHSILNEMGIGLVSTIKKSDKHIKFIVICSSFTLEQELMMIRKGISGIVSNTTTYDALVEVVRKVYAGDIWIRREALNAIVESGLDLNVPEESEGKNLQLTKREKEILSLIGTGCSNLEIASRLFINEATVKTHVSHIYKKMNIHNRLEAVILAKKSNI